MFFKPKKPKEFSDITPNVRKINCSSCNFVWFYKMFSGGKRGFHSCYVLLNIGHGLKRLIGPINCKWDLTAAITKIYIDGGWEAKKRLKVI